MRVLRLAAGMAVAVAATGVVLVAPAARASVAVRCQGRIATIVVAGAHKRVVGTSHADVISALGAGDMIVGGAGNDVICAGSAKSIDGGAGNDRITFTASPIVHGDAGDDTITQVGTGNPTVYGDAGDDVISLGRGNGKAYGGDGNDRLVSGPAGRQLLEGGRGNDILTSRGATLKLDGGAGTDIFSFPKADGRRTSVVDKTGDLVNGQRVAPVSTTPPAAGAPTPGGPSPTASTPPPVVPVPTSPPSVQALLSYGGVTGHAVLTRQKAETAVGFAATELDLAYTPGAYPVRSWQLAFGDGAPSWTGPGSPPADVSHHYFAQGTYAAALTVTDASGSSATSTLGLDIADPPTASLVSNTPSPVTATGGATTVSVTLSGSPNGDAKLTSYDVSWGDGSQDATGTPTASMTLSHTFTAPASYTISGNVVDDHGGESGSNVYVAIQDAAVHPHLLVTGSSDNISYAQAGVTYGDPITAASTESYVTAELIGAAASSGAMISSETVDWGDGTKPDQVSLHDPYIDHTYASPGSYTISATVTDSAMHTTTETSPMTVIAPGTVATATAPASVPVGSAITVSTAGSAPAAGAKLTDWTLAWSDGLLQRGQGAPPATISRPTSALGQLEARLGVGDDHTDAGYTDLGAVAVTGAVVSGAQTRAGTWTPLTLGPLSGTPGDAFLEANLVAPSSGHQLTHGVAAFGDGAAPATSNFDAYGNVDFEHAYTSVGTYDASLALSDDAPSTTTNTYTMDVGGAPTLTVTPSDQHPHDGESVTFTVTAAAGQATVPDYYTEAAIPGPSDSVVAAAGNGLPSSVTFTVHGTAGTSVGFDVQTCDNHGGVATAEANLTIS